MVQPTVLKRRHSLKGVNLLPLVKRIKAANHDSVKEFARVHKDSRTETLDFEEVDRLFSQLTGENIRELLEMAGRDISIEEARWALHCSVIYANEVGQPQSQNLCGPDLAILGFSTGAAVQRGDKDEPPQKKRKDDDNGDLVDKSRPKQG